MEKVHMVVEGVSATRAAKTLAERMGVDMPIAGEAYRILFEGKNAMEAVRNLMTRSRKHETEEPGW
jgi:glycerol-3-phosphate dehydrogenase (NAD(P)+)